MKNIVQVRRYLQQQEGATIIIVAIVLTVLLGFAALAVDIGYFMVGRNELQNVADAAALAGARQLGHEYEIRTYEEKLVYVCDPGTIYTVANNVAMQNKAAGVNISINNNADDFIIGNWNPSKKKIEPVTNAQPDAVTVTARRDTQANSPISTFFARIFNKNFVEVSATATAALTGQSTAGPGGLPLPVAINESWISKLPCNEDLTFHPSSDDVCSAWHSYDASAYSPSGNDMLTMINAITAGTYSSPLTVAGQTQYDFTNGTLANVFTHTAIQDLFAAMKVKNDGYYDMDDNPETWTTSVPIYDDSKAECNPNRLLTIVGFTTITIYKVIAPPDSTIYATVKCDNVVTGRSGGGNYGTKGTIPGLVQ